MKRFTPLFPLWVLALAMLACTIQSQAAARPAQFTPTPAPKVDSTGSGSTLTPAQTIPTPPTMPTAAALICEVSTGTPGGWLNLRAGPGMAYPVRAVLQESNRLTVTTRAGGWLEVQTLAGQIGWVYSAFLECNP